MQPSYSLRQLEYFVAVAEHKSVARAANAIGVSQPSVSTALAKLEAQFGLQLFLRHHAQGVSLTTDGGRLLAIARNLLRDADELRRNMLNEGGAVAGELKVGAFVTLAAAYMPELISGFRKRYPNVSIRLSERTQDELIEGLKSGNPDLAIVYTAGLPTGLKRARLCAFPPYILLPAGHRLASKKTIRLKELAAEPLILLDVVPSRNYFLGLLRSSGIEPILFQSSPSIEVVRGLVAKGMGYSLLVTRPFGDHSYDGAPLAVRSIGDRTEPAEIAIVQLPGLRTTRLMQAFVDHCLSVFAKKDQCER